MQPITAMHSSNVRQPISAVIRVWQGVVQGQCSQAGTHGNCLVWPSHQSPLQHSPQLPAHSRLPWTHLPHCMKPAFVTPLFRWATPFAKPFSSSGFCPLLCASCPEPTALSPLPSAHRTHRSVLSPISHIDCPRSIFCTQSPSAHHCSVINFSALVSVSASS